jgi:4-hydroxybenzoyl-CoA thioesterase
MTAYRTNITVRRIEWGECDPAGIVFYPRFFAMFDNATTLLFSTALGMTKYQFLNKYGCAGYPMVDTRARFLVPARFGDDVTIETAVTEIKRSSFQITHHLKKDDVLCVEGFETRVWTGRDPADPDKIRSQPIPAEVVEKLSLP